MKKNLFEVHQGFDEDYFREVLTRDVTPAEAIYDLIDNSIDAARDSLISAGPYKKDKYGLPASYAGFRIALRITPNGIYILDNARGLSRSELANDTFKIGQPSDHKHGIGFFGVGLKRSLLTLGETYQFETRTTGFAARINFNSSDLASRDKPLIAETLNKKGAPCTIIGMQNLRPGPAHEFAADQKLKRLRRAVQIRYGLFIKKGLKISINGVAVAPFGPEIRQSGPISPQTAHLSGKKVDTFVESGMHTKYRSTKEKDYDKSTNDSLTEEYGWYVVCNDRIIELASKQPRLGFSASWHAEYNGFLGWVHFVASHPGNLPWDTKKSRIDTNSVVFQAVYPKLKAFSDSFRTANRQIRKPSPTPSPPKPASPKPPTPPPPPPPKPHINEWSKLLPTLEFNWKDAKLDSLLAEGESIGLFHSYSSSALLRMIVERALGLHIKKSGNLPSIKAFYAQEKAKQSESPSQKQIENFDPSLRWMVEWLKTHPEYFPPEVRSECTKSLGKFISALGGVLNDAVHGSLIIDSSAIKAVRNDTYPLLKHLLETDPVGQKQF